MGADISLPIASVPNSTTIYTKTQPTIDIMNKILDFILKNADYRDMIALANEKECEKWIIIAEKKISELFQKIKLQPELGSNGVIYLKKIDSLKQNNDILGCKLVAAFFIRLFQIVGALSLSIMDTKIPDRSDYLIEVEGTTTQEKKGIPFFKPVEEKKSFFGLFGGELDSENLTTISSELHLFRRYLTKLNNNKYALSTIPTRTNPSINVPGYEINIQNNKLKFNCTLANSSIVFELSVTESTLNIDVLQRNGKDYPFNENFLFSPQNDGTLLVTFFPNRQPIDFANFIGELRTKISQLPPSQTIKILEELNYLESSRIKPYFKKIKNINFKNEENSGIFVKESDYKSEQPRFLFGYPIVKDNKRYDLLVSFNLIIIKSNNEYTVEITNLNNDSSSERLKFTPSFDYSSDDDEGDKNLKTGKKNIRRFTVKTSGIGYYSNEPTNNRQTIPNFLQKRFETIITQAENTLELGPVKTREGYLNPVNDSSLKNSRLKTRELWTTLTRSPPVKSFCTARALQLLNISGLQRILPEKIRPLIFNTSFDLIKDGSLPKPGQSITTAAGIKALSSLYSSFEDIYTGKEYNSEKDKKKVSLGKLIVSFMMEQKELENITQIIENPGDKVEPFLRKGNEQKLTLLREQARLLFQTQFEHTQKVNKLLQKLFVFSEPITLNPNILAKGIRGIEEVASEARDLLSDYYSKCQLEYTKGVKILVGNPVQQTYAPAPKN